MKCTHVGFDILSQKMHNICIHIGWATRFSRRPIVIIIYIVKCACSAEMKRIREENFMNILNRFGTPVSHIYSCS